MPDQPMAAAPDLADDLRRYFAITTATGMPSRVRAMSARTLQTRRRSFGPLLGGGGVVLATAALVVVLVASHHGGTTSGLSSSGAAALPAKGAAPATLSYPGVDTSRLAQAGDVLQPPAGHGTAQVTAAQAQTAVAAQPGAGLPGPAVLAWAQLGDATPPITCLCWVVEVPIGGGVVSNPTAASPPTPPTQNVLVFVDATTGRIVDTVPAIP